MKRRTADHLALFTEKMAKATMYWIEENSIKKAQH